MLPGAWKRGEFDEKVLWKNEDNIPNGLVIALLFHCHIDHPPNVIAGATMVHCSLEEPNPRQNPLHALYSTQPYRCLWFLNACSHPYDFVALKGTNVVVVCIIWYGGDKCGVGSLERSSRPLSNPSTSKVLECQLNLLNEEGGRSC